MQIEIDFYELPDREEPVRLFLESLDEKTRAKMYREIDLLLLNGPDLREPHSKAIENGIFELRAKSQGNVARVLFFFYFAGKAVLTNGFLKKTQKTPKTEIELAIKYRKDYLSRNKAKE